MTPFVCGSSVYEDARGYIADEYRPIVDLYLVSEGSTQNIRCPLLGKKVLFIDITCNIYT